MAIAAELDIHQTAVAYWLKKINAEYAALAVDQAAYKLKLLAELEYVKREAWREWDGDENRSGNPAYLAQVQKAIEQERALLGLDAPTKIAPTTPDGHDEYTGATDRLLAFLASALERTRSAEGIGETARADG